MADLRDVARDPAVDLARGLAGVLMVQTHAFHGWVAPAFHQDAGFVATRWLGTFPLPGFLMLAGVAVALRVRSGLAQRDSMRRVRAGLARRALEVLALAYTTNLAWALIDGDVSLRRIMYADVLHAIGLSLLVVALLIAPNTDGRFGPRPLGRAALWLALVVSVASPFLTRATRDMVGPLRYLVAPFAEVRGLTAMPVFPLAAWCAFGVVVGIWLTEETDTPIRTRRIHTLGLMGLCALVVGNYVTGAVSAALHEPLSRASVALWPNVVEGAGRGLCLLWCGAWLSRWLPLRVQRVLARYGAASLWIYVAHVPFCYGRLAGPLRGSLSLQSALPLVLVLIVVSYGVALVQRRMLGTRSG